MCWRNCTGSAFTRMCMDVVNEHMWTALVCINVSVCALSFCPWVHVCVRVCWAVCAVGWPGKTCLSVPGTSLAFLSPKVPQLCPKAGKLGGGDKLTGRSPSCLCSLLLQRWDVAGRGPDLYSSPTVIICCSTPCLCEMVGVQAWE